MHRNLWLQKLKVGKYLGGSGENWNIKKLRAQKCVWKCLN